MSPVTGRSNFECHAFARSRTLIPWLAGDYREAAKDEIGHTGRGRRCACYRRPIDISSEGGASESAGIGNREVEGESGDEGYFALPFERVGLPGEGPEARLKVNGSSH